MAEVKPFRGVRYTEKAGALAAVVAPPYDVIGEDARQGLLELSPYNIVRVDIAADGYETAAGRWRKWRDDGIVALEEKPALYAYKQTYKGPDGRTTARIGVMGAVKLAAYDEGIVFPHERTLSGPKADRLQLMRATRTQLSPVFGLHFGAKTSVEQLIQPALAKTRPAMSVVDPDGVVNEMWVLTQPDLLHAVTDALQPAQIVIADGHHRYETALAFRDEQRARAGTDPQSEQSAWCYVLMMLVDIQSPGLTVFPTHRIVQGVPPFRGTDLLNRLQGSYTLTAIADKGDRAGAVLRALDTLGERPGFALYNGNGEMWLARLADYESWVQMTPDRVPAWRNLDVASMHRLALPALGLDDELQSSGDYMSYTYTTEEAMAAVDDGAGVLALLVRPTPSQAVKEVALAGQNMPQKSTYYYPKLLTGLVMSDLDTHVGL